jgi:hypothetical protein
MSVGPRTVARVAFPNRVTSWTESEAHVLIHADLSSSSNAQAEDPFRAPDKNRTSAHIQAWRAGAGIRGLGGC